MSTRSVKSSPSAIGSTLHSFPQHLNLNTERDVEHESLLQSSSARHLTQEEEDAAMKIKSVNANGQQQSSGDLRAAAAYMCVAILLIFFNKTAFSRYHFNAPNVLTLSQNVGSLIMLMVAKQCKWLDYQSFSMRNFRRLLPLSLAFIAYVVFGMWAMKVVNIPMYTTLRRMSILFVMLMEWFISRKSSTYTVKLSVLIMLLGAGIAGYRDLNFDVQAYGIVILFNLCTAIYLVLINQISTEEKSAAAMNGLTPPLQKYDFMYYNNLVSIPLVLILLGASGEGSLALSFTGWSDVGFQVALISSSVLAFVLNATIFWNTSVNSALTQTVSGQAKDVILVFIGYACFDDAHFDPVNMVGILVGFGGSIFYAVNKLVPSCAVEPFLLSMGCMETNKKDDTALTPVPSPGFGLLGGGNRLRRSPSQNYGGPSKCRTVTGWIVSCAIGAIIMTLVHRGGITTGESSDLQASMQQLPTTITNLLQPSAATIEQADADKKEASRLVEVAQSLNATVHYKHAFILQQRRLLERECVRQLIAAGWTREQTEQADDDTYWRMTRKELRSDRPTDPPTPTWSDEQHRAWVEMGCLDHVTWWRAYQQVQHNYAGLLKIQQDFELRRGAEVEKAGMQRGLYSLSHRREGQCGIGSDKLSCVIALSLFGSSPRYTRAIMSSVRRMSKIFPGWELRIYYDHTVPGNILTKLQSHADRVAHLIAQSDNGSLDPMIAPLKLVNVSATIWPVGSPELDRIHGSFYRYLVADDVTVDRWVSRDCDALLLKRDYLAVQEWMGSKWTWHTMADYPQHGLMLAGMWGAINYARVDGIQQSAPTADGQKKVLRTMVEDAFDGRSMKQLIEEYTLSLLKPGNPHAASPKFYGVDQTFQMDVIWPKFRRDYIRHDSYHCTYHPNSYSFPSPREEPYIFIGQTQLTNEDGESQYDSAIRTEVPPPDANRQPAPVECRRKPEWLYG